MPTGEDSKGKVVKMAQELLSDDETKAAITPALIREKVQLVLSINPRWRESVDVEAAVDELIRRFSIWIGVDKTLSSSSGHEPWLTAARMKDSRYWQRYREWMERRLSVVTLDALDKSTGSVLALLEDPQRPGRWDRRGLVVGHVQSGKTGHYTGLICKAADAGYKIVIVLAGLHNNLRAQTQMRLDEGFLGYETKPSEEELRVVGVGEIDADPLISPNYATNRSERGDFNEAAFRNLGISPEQRPWLFVVKKNKSVLERLLRWIRNHVADATDAETKRRLVTQLPLLLIDDEADHASVDTQEQVFDESGAPDPEHEPTAINSRIRKILHTFARAAYVGYTATPFANIFIHERGETSDEGPDLFPAAFVVNLAAPSNYVGPRAVFGTPGPDGRVGGLPLVTKINDYASSDNTGGWMPTKHKNGHLPVHQGQDTIPPSLVQAIDSFLIASSVKNLRGLEREHSSMLVHVTRFTSVQGEVVRQIEEHLRTLKQRMLRGIEVNQIASRMEKLWRDDFVPTSEAVRAAVALKEDAVLPDWSAVWDEMKTLIQDVEIRTINGTAKDALDYGDNGGVGLKVIAVGGDKLARGLTLEGLCTSYFLRASRMYDTLMQMGRWFGYRPGYLDLCRLYTTDELVTWFGHIADASEELREEFDLMVASGATPREYGLRVQSHPVLMVTSQLKMRATRDLMLSFSGELLETVAFHRKESILNENRRGVRRLLEELGAPEQTDPVRKRSSVEQGWKGYLWRNATSEQVSAFLAAYRTHPEAYKVRSELLAEFIQSMSDGGELKNWTVAVIGGGEGRSEEMAPGIRVDMLKRKNSGDYSDRYSIGRLLSPRDESIDLSNEAWDAALSLTRAMWKPDPAKTTQTAPDLPGGPAMRKVRGFGAPGVAPETGRGLLLLSVLDPVEAGLPADTPPIVAFGISFPGSSSGRKVVYKVNSVQWQQWEREYGSAG